MIFEVQSGDKSYEIDAPDQASATQAIGGLLGGMKGDRQPMAPGAVPHATPADTVQGGPPPPPPSAASDIADSAASRTQAGLLDVAGTGGDLVGLANNAADLIASPITKGLRWLEGKPQQTPEEQAAAQAQVDARGSPLGFLPNSQDVKKAVGFEAYQPQTGAGQTFDKYVGSGIELAPSVLAGGVGGGVKKVAGDLIKYAAAPAAASEVAGDATKGTALEPWARLGAAVATGGVAGARREATAASPVIEEIRAESKSLYDAAKQQGVTIKPAALDKAITDITKNASAFGIDPTIHPKSFAALKRLNEFKDVAPVNGVKTVASLEDVDMMRQILGDAAGSMDKADSMRAMQMRDQLDNFVSGLKPSDVLSGDPKAAANMLIKARSLWARQSKAQTVADIFEKATNRAAANYTGGAGVETAVRQEFKSLANNPKRMRGFTPDEKAAVLKVVRGGPVRGLLRFFGKFAPRDLLTTVLGGGAALHFGGPVGLAGLAGAEVAKRTSTAMTMAAARRADELIRSGAPKVKGVRRPLPFTPLAVLPGFAASQSSDPTKQGR